MAVSHKGPVPCAHELQRSTTRNPRTMRIVSLDHLVLTVQDIPRTVTFYTTVLGMSEVSFGGRTALAFGNQKINLHKTGREFDPKAAHPTPGSADLCLVADTLIETVIAELKSHTVEIVEGPVLRTGARGPILSVYFRDPDGNLVEVSNYAEAGELPK